MTGVEILAVEEFVAETAFNWEAFTATYFVIFALYLIIGFAISIRCGNYSNVLIGVVSGLIFGAVFGYISGENSRVPIAHENHYKVIVSDEVPMNEFLGKYEIINYEGKIYTVIERD